MPSLKEFREKRGELYEQMKGIAAEAEGKEWTPEQREKFDRLEAEDRNISETCDRLAKMEKRQLDKAEEEDRRQRSDYENKKAGLPTSIDRRNAFTAWALGEKRQTEETRSAADRLGMNVQTNELTMTFSRNPKQYMARATTAAQDSTSAAQGANAVENEPMQMIEKALLAFGGLREAATVIRSRTGATMQFPTANDTTAMAVVVGQNSAIDTEDVPFGQTTIPVFKYTSQFVKASVEFMQDLSVDFAPWVGEVLGERVARGTNNDFTAGATDAAQPAGAQTEAISLLTTASGSGISYNRLLLMEHSLDPAYRRRGARWMFHDSVLRSIKQLTDSQGRLLWVPGIAASEPDTILGYPYTVNQDCSTLTTASTTAKVILFGDFSAYKIRDVMDVTLTRLNERFAELGQVAFFTLSRHGGATIQASTVTPPIVAMFGANT